MICAGFDCCSLPRYWQGSEQHRKRTHTASISGRHPSCCTRWWVGAECMGRAGWRWRGQCVHGCALALDIRRQGRSQVVFKDRCDRSELFIQIACFASRFTPMGFYPRGGRSLAMRPSCPSFRAPTLRANWNSKRTESLYPRVMRHNIKPFGINPGCISATAISEFAFIPDWFGASPISFHGLQWIPKKTATTSLTSKKC